MSKVLSPEEQIAALKAELAQSQARVGELEHAEKQRTETEPLIKAKMDAGLSREQAETVVKQQREHDAYVKKADEARAAKAKEAKK